MSSCKLRAQSPRFGGVTLSSAEWRRADRCFLDPVRGCGGTRLQTPQTERCREGKYARPPKPCLLLKQVRRGQRDSVGHRGRRKTKPKHDVDEPKRTLNLLRAGYCRSAILALKMRPKYVIVLILRAINSNTSDFILFVSLDAHRIQKARSSRIWCL